MKLINEILTVAVIAFVVSPARTHAHSVDEDFSVKEYDEFHRVLHPLQHEALPRKDFAQIRSKAPELVKRGQAIVNLGIPKGMAEEHTEDFTKELAKFSSALQKFRTDSRRASDDQLSVSYNSVHDSFEMLAAMLPRKKSPAPENTSTYFTLRRDMRRCASPMCGGPFVRRVNQSRTRCGDGRLKAECYVSRIEWNGQREVEVGKALLRGQITSEAVSHRGKFDVLRVSESWEAASDSAGTDTFYRVRDKGVRCITFPCPTHREATLNSTVSRDIAGVDLSAAGATDTLIGEANQAMTGSEGILVVGSHAPATGPGGRSVTLKASRFYLQRK